MTNDEFGPILLEFIKRRLNGDKFMDIISDYLAELSITQHELIILHDFLVYNYPQDLVDAMNDKSPKALMFIKFITEGWMERAKLSAETTKTIMSMSLPITKN